MTAVVALSALVAHRYTPSPEDLTEPADSAAQILTNLYTPPNTPLDKRPRSRLPSSSSALAASGASLPSDGLGKLAEMSADLSGPLVNPSQA